MATFRNYMVDHLRSWGLRMSWSNPLLGTVRTCRVLLRWRPFRCTRTNMGKVITRNRGHFASVINCQRHLFFKMADKNNRSQGKRFPYDILNNLSSLDLFYEVYIPWNKKDGYWVRFGVVRLFLFRVRPKWSFANMAFITRLQLENWRK